MARIGCVGDGSGDRAGFICHKLVAFNLLFSALAHIRTFSFTPFAWQLGFVYHDAIFRILDRACRRLKIHDGMFQNV